jgi:hypothetical protein
MGLRRKTEKPPSVSFSVVFGRPKRLLQWDVPLAAALAFVRASDPANYWKENIERQYQASAQVRGRHYTERKILMEMARTVAERIG